MIKKIDGKYTTAPSKPPRELDASRRDLALTMASLLGAGAFLKGCASPERSEKEDEDNVAERTAELQSSSIVLWFDTYAELRTYIGGTTSASGNIAFGRDLRTGGLFGWSTDTTTADNDATIIVPTKSVRTGCWKRIYSGPLDVRWFGAKGDGNTVDTNAIQNAVNYALIHGDELYFAPGYYVINNTINIGTPIFSNYSFVNRTSKLGALTFVPNSRQYNKTNYRNISLTFAPNAFIVANFSPSEPKPAIAYNLDNFHGTGFVRDLKVIGPSAFVNREFNLDAPTPAANVIGFFSFTGCSQIDKPMVVGLAFGIATATSYWCAIREMTAFSCGDGLNLAEGNAMTVSNATFFNCRRGVVFDGASAKIMQIHTEQVDYDLVIFAADCCTFGPGYLEDSRSSVPVGSTYLTAGAKADDLVTNCVYDNLRIAGLNNSKAGIVMQHNRDVTFINVRTYQRSVTASADSYGTLLNCDDPLSSLDRRSWSSVSQTSHLAVAGSIGTKGTNRRLVGTVWIPYAYDFGSIPAETTILRNLSYTFEVNFTDYSVLFQATTSGSDKIVMAARISLPPASSNNIVVRATNPTNSPVLHNFAGHIIVQLFQA